MCAECLPGVDVHEQHQRLHSDHVDAFTVKPRNFEHFQIRYTQHDQREQESERVQSHGENDELRPGRLCPGVAESARCVKVVVTNPGSASGNRGEAQRVYPRVSQRYDRIPVPYPGVVTEREHHRDPPIDAEGCHAQHGVCGEKSVEESDNLTEAATSGVAHGHDPDKS